MGARTKTVSEMTRAGALEKRIAKASDDVFLAQLELAHRFATLAKLQSQAGNHRRAGNCYIFAAMGGTNKRYIKNAIAEYKIAGAASKIKMAEKLAKDFTMSAKEAIIDVEETAKYRPVELRK